MPVLGFNKPQDGPRMPVRPGTRTVNQGERNVKQHAAYPIFAPPAIRNTSSALSAPSGVSSCLNIRNESLPCASNPRARGDGLDILRRLRLKPRLTVERLRGEGY